MNVPKNDIIKNYKKAQNIVEKAGVLSVVIFALLYAVFYAMGDFHWSLMVRVSSFDLRAKLIISQVILLLEVILLSLIFGALWVKFCLHKNLKYLDRLYSINCDFKNYWDLCNFAVEYGSGLNKSRGQAWLYREYGKRAVIADIMAGQYEKAQQVLAQIDIKNKRQKQQMKASIDIFQTTAADDCPLAFTARAKGLGAPRVMDAQKAYRQKQYAMAFSLMNDQQAKYPADEISRLFFCGKCLLRQNNPQGAASFFVQAANHSGDLPCQRWARNYLNR